MCRFYNPTEVLSVDSVRGGRTVVGSTTGGRVKRKDPQSSILGHIIYNIYNMNARQEQAAAKKLTEQINALRVAAGSTPLGKAPSLPDTPACDFCGKMYSANLICGQCQSVFYCSAVCQKAHWKKGGGSTGGGGGGGGHRAECNSMRETCDKKAQRAVEQMKNNMSGTCGYTRIDNTMLETLDGTGAYRAAVTSFGLNDAIRQLFIDDRAELLSRYANPGFAYCYTNSVMMTLFRGQRMEGQGMSSNSFGCIDGQRIKLYVKSHPDAFMHW